MSVVENFFELVDIEEINSSNEYDNSVDLTIDEDESFVLSNGLISHNSAKSAFRDYSDPNFQGAFPLRGKFINVMELPNVKVIKNEEVKNLLGAIGLKMGESPTNLRFGKIYLYTDADPDGDSIAGLLMNFFGKYWPELFEEGRILRVLTPLVVVEKGKEKHWFYTSQEFQDWEVNQKNMSQWKVSYKKGLAALENDEYKEIIRNPKAVTIDKGDKFTETLSTWFSSDSVPRKHKILGTEMPEPIEVAVVKKEKIAKGNKIELFTLNTQNNAKPRNQKKEKPNVDIKAASKLF